MRAYTFSSSAGSAIRKRSIGVYPAAAASKSGGARWDAESPELPLVIEMSDRGGGGCLCGGFSAAVGIFLRVG